MVDHKNEIKNYIKNNYSLTESINITKINLGNVKIVYKVIFSKTSLVFKFNLIEKNSKYIQNDMFYKEGITSKLIESNSNFSVEEYIDGHHLVIDEFYADYEKVIDNIYKIQCIGYNDKKNKSNTFEFLKNLKKKYVYPGINIEIEIDNIKKQIETINQSNILFNIKLCHRDLKFDNILKNGNTIFFIDFDLLDYDWCIMDIAGFSFNYIYSLRFGSILNLILKKYLGYLTNDISKRNIKEDKLLLLLSIKIFILRKIISRYDRYLIYKSQNNDIADRNQRGYYECLESLNKINLYIKKLLKNKNLNYM